MTLIYSAVAVLVVAQIVGIYALVSHKADVVFAFCVVTLVVAAAALAGYGAYTKLY
ncbi:MAG: hypothetical protein ACRDY0_02600 [Acidimicrobiales bacterium]